MKQVDATFTLNFTTKNVDKLPTPRQMDCDLQELFAIVLDGYLSNKGITGNEVHLITSNRELFTIEDYED